MDINRATEILTALSDGIDPKTGEILSDDSVFQNPEVVRALFLSIRALEKYQKDQNRRNSLPANAGKPWSLEEDDLLSEGFDNGYSVDELSENHQRTRGAIVSRLERIGKIDKGSFITLINNTPIED